MTHRPSLESNHQLKAFSFHFWGFWFIQVCCFIISPCGSSPCLRFVFGFFFCLSARAIIGFSQFYCAHSSWSRALARTGMTAQCVGHCSGIHPCPAINMTLPHLVIFLCLQIPNRPSILAGDSHSAVQRVRQEGLQSSGQPLSSVRVWLITAEVRWGRSTEQHGLTQQPEILDSIFFSFQFIVY